MRHKKLFLILISSFAIANHVNSQGLRSGLSYLYTQFRPDVPGGFKQGKHRLWRNTTYTYLKNGDTTIFGMNSVDIMGITKKEDSVLLEVGEKAYGFNKKSHQGPKNSLTLLYDYTLGIGDTFRLSLWPGEPFIYRVFSIDSIVLSNNDTFQIWSLIYTGDPGAILPYIYWVRGIGGGGNQYDRIRNWTQSCQVDYRDYIDVPDITELPVWQPPQLGILCDSLGEVVYHDQNFEPSCDSARWEQYIKVKNVEQELITIYPNPANNKITIGIDYPDKVLIFNAEGKIVNYNLKFSSEEQTISTKDFSNGVYMVYALKEGRLFSAKFSISH